MAELGAVTECEIAPPSDQLLNTCSVPPETFCGEVVAMVWGEPAAQFSFNGAATNGPPSAETRRFAGLVVIVIGVVVVNRSV